jgi:NAD(P)-dependent dehydrogenase (short-subunit alcohol dehydrogenase family)
VNVSSLARQPIDFDDVMLTRGYTGGRAYAQSKLAQIMFTFNLARIRSRDTYGELLASG